MIDIEKFICSLLADHPEGVTVRGDIHRALKEQGLEYKDGKIVPIEDKTELKESRDERIRKSIIGFLITISSLKDGKTVSNKDFDTKAILEWIAWLEKQGNETPCDRCKKSQPSHSCQDITELGRCYLEHEKQGEQKPTQRKDFISIPFGAFDSELIEETIIIPDGCVATIEGNKIHIKKK